MVALINPPAIWMPSVALIMSRPGRAKLEALVSVAISLLDAMDATSDTDAPNFSRRSDGWPGLPDEAEREEDFGAEEAGELTSRESIHQGADAIAPFDDDDPWIVPVTLNMLHPENDR